MRIDTDPKLDFSDVLLRPKRSKLASRSEVDINRTIVMPHSGHHFFGVPIITANMDTVGTFEMANVLSEFGVATALHKHYKMGELVAHYTSMDCHPDEAPWHFYSMGVVDRDLAKFEAVYKATAKDGGNFIHGVCIDVANGYSKPFLEFVKRFREKYPELTIMAGNVVTGEMTEDLIYHGGCDIVKVGIGPGSVCTTRKMTGVGYPQLSAIIECADAAHGVGGHICADGGCTVPGDVAKAFAAGGDFVMLGGMLAGHKECHGVLCDKDGNLLNDYTPGSDKYMVFYGMSSKMAMDKHHGGVAEYRASEGKSVLVPYKGSVEDTIKEILGGVRSACTYTGSVTLKELPKRATFVLVHNQLNTVFGNG